MLLIYGTGRVGQAVASLARFKNISCDLRDDTNPPTDFGAYDTIVPSPGIAPTHPLYRAGEKTFLRGILDRLLPSPSPTIVPELDFAQNILCDWQSVDDPQNPREVTIIAVTGTDGKSTTAWIAYSLLRGLYGDERIFLSGNFDEPFSETVQKILEKNPNDPIYIVVEVSSFMSAFIEKFTPTVTIWTNFAPDHLNWHTDLADYFRAKKRLLDFTSWASIVSDQVISFAHTHQLSLDLYHPLDTFGDTGENSTDGEVIYLDGKEVAKLSETRLTGKHNAKNLLSVLLAFKKLDISIESVRPHLGELSGLSHRLEFVTEKNAVRYIDDSKSTSAQSLAAALESFKTETSEKKVILICGGSDKGDSFDHLQDIFTEVVKHAVCIGATRDKFTALATASGVTCETADTMEEAVRKCQALSIPGDTILLSPGCASFGMFKNYLDRAEQFRKCI